VKLKLRNFLTIKNERDDSTFGNFDQTPESILSRTRSMINKIVNANDIEDNKLEKPEKQEKPEREDKRRDYTIEVISNESTTSKLPLNVEEEKSPPFYTAKIKKTDEFYKNTEETVRIDSEFNTTSLVPVQDGDGDGEEEDKAQEDEEEKSYPQSQSPQLQVQPSKSQLSSFKTAPQLPSFLSEQLPPSQPKKKEIQEEDENTKKRREIQNEVDAVFNASPTTIQKNNDNN